MKEFTFTDEQVKMLADAVWMRQRCFIAGDRKFREYGAILDQFFKDINYVPSGT